LTIDCLAQDLWKHSYNSQTDLTAQDGTVTIQRIGQDMDTAGWTCTRPALTPDNRWRWRQTLTLSDNVAHSVDFLLPSDSGTYFDQNNITSIYSEGFYVHRGLFQIFYWNLEVQQENNPAWIPLRQWIIGPNDYENTTPPLYKYGFRVSTYQ